MKSPDLTAPLARFELLAAIAFGSGALAQGVIVLDDAPPEVVAVGPSEELEELHHEIYERTYDGQIGCIPVLAVVDGTVVWEQGFGWADRDRKRAASSETIYPIASVSKGLVRLAASLLVAEGKLDWESPVSEVLDCFALQTGSWVETDLLVRDLAQMTAGMRHGGMDWLRDAPAAAHDGSLLATERFAIVDENPGREFRYSNYTSGVLEAVVFDVGGEPLELLLQRRFFEPLGMTSTSAMPDIADSLLVRVRSGSYEFDTPSFSPPSAGLGFYSSAKDLARLAALHLDQDLCDKIGVPKDAVTYSRSRRDGSAVGPADYWLGWGAVQDESNRFHISNGPIYDATSCIVLSLERDVAVICLPDTKWDSRVDGARLADVIAMRVMDALVGGCSDAFQQGEQQHELSESGAEHEPILAQGNWTGTRTLAGEAFEATLEIQESRASLPFGGISATCSGLRDTSGHLEGSFGTSGELNFFGETSELSSLSIRVKRLEKQDLVVGSAILSAYSTDRKVAGSGAALLEFSRE